MADGLLNRHLVVACLTRCFAQLSMTMVLEMVGGCHVV